MSKQPARRFLAAQARSGNGHGYLNQPQRPLPPKIDADLIAEEAKLVQLATAMCDEPEAVGPAIVDAFTDLARTYDRIRYEAEVEQAQRVREQLSIEARMADAERRAKLRHADISGEMHVVKMMLVRARKGGRVDPPAALERVRKIEARLDYRHDLADAA